jgi:LPPG:FO 2-phospho-L-lactate transferase
MSDQPVESRMITSEGELSFQEYFVKYRWRPEVKRVFYDGIERSEPAPGVIDAIDHAAGIIFCPSNPITSIGPILAVPGIRPALERSPAPIVGVSPLVGASAISGPAHLLLAAQGWEVSAYGVAKGYAGLLKAFIVATEDEKHRQRIEALGMRTLTAAIRMNSLADKRLLARAALALMSK